MEAKKVLIRSDGVKYIIVPKKSKIKEGELVLITNNLSLITKFMEEESNERRKKRRS